VGNEGDAGGWGVVGGNCSRDARSGLLIVGRMLTDPVWYFFQFWFAKYLYDGRGPRSEKPLGHLGRVSRADVGALSGGCFPGFSSSAALHLPQAGCG